MLLVNFLNKLIKKKGFNLIDATGKIHKIGNENLSEKSLSIKLLDKKLHYKLLYYPDLYFGEAYTDGTIKIENGNLTDVLDIIFFNMGRGNLNLANSIITDMVRIAIQQTITLPFTNFVEGLFKNADGNAFMNGKVQKYAYGGVVNRPTLFPMANGMGLMGEAGAEAILPLRRGSNGKLGVQASGGGVGNIVVNVDAFGSTVEGDEQGGKELGRVIAVAIQSEIINQKRPGGLLA